MDYNKEIFKGKTIAKLMEEAYKDKNEKSSQLRAMINQLKDLITDGGDAVMMVPLIKEYMDLLIVMVVFKFNCCIFPIKYSKVGDFSSCGT